MGRSTDSVDGVDLYSLSDPKEGFDGQRDMTRLYAGQRSLDYTEAVSEVKL